jgi:hypothetical protein
MVRNGSSASRRAVACLSASSIRKPSNSCSDRKREMQRTWLGIFGQWSVHSLYRRMTSCCTPQQGSKRRPPACCLLCITDDCSEPSDFNWWITSLHFCSSFRLNKSAPKASKRCSQETTGQHILKTMGSHSVRGLIQSQNRRVRWYSCRILLDSCRCHMWICIQSRPVLAKTPSPCALCAYTSFRQWRPCTALIPAQMKL